MEKCKLLTDDKGKIYLTMPDGTKIPAQIKTIAIQDSVDAWAGHVLCKVEVWALAKAGPTVDRIKEFKEVDTKGMLSKLAI